MYLTLKQHDLFRTLLMGFEIPFRSYVAHTIVDSYDTKSKFENAMVLKKNQLTASDPSFLRVTLPRACTGGELSGLYDKLVLAGSAAAIVPIEQEVPKVGGLNIVTFALTGEFSDLYALFGGYTSYCALAEKYRFDRNKLDHPGCKTLEESDLVPVLSFVKEICTFLDERCFIQKSRDELLSEVTALQKRKIEIPIAKHNFTDMPYGESRIVCREKEVEKLKRFIYGEPGDLRKRHSCCIFGYGGVGKTALALEAVKELVQDIQDGHTVNEYSPEYVFFFSAKKRRLDIFPATGKIIEKSMAQHFETAEELFGLIFESLGVQSLRNYHREGLILIDNLEALLEEERDKIKHFIEAQTPAEMQFLITSRNSEAYEQSERLAGFEKESGIEFVQRYIEENELEMELTEDEIKELLSLSKGNTLVLVLCLRRLSQRLSSISGLKAEFSSAHAWRNIRKALKNIPGDVYEVISSFMFKDTFEEMEKVFAEDIGLFYKILNIFAVYQEGGVDLNTICMLSKEPYPKVESVVDSLCNYLILEKKKEQYTLNDFAEKYIIDRFMPDSLTFESLSGEIRQRERQIQQELARLQEDIASRPELNYILRDWRIFTDSDRIAAAKMYRQYGEARRECSRDSKLHVQTVLEEFQKVCQEVENVTAHPYIKYQKARILRLIDDSRLLEEAHMAEIEAAYQDAIFNIKVVEQYASIGQTKSYASLLWQYGQYLSDNHKLAEAIRYLEDSQTVFAGLKTTEEAYYQCMTKLGTIYLEYFEQNRERRGDYLRKARIIRDKLQGNYKRLGKARSYADSLKQSLQRYEKWSREGKPPVSGRR